MYPPSKGWVARAAGAGPAAAVHTFGGAVMLRKVFCAAAVLGFAVSVGLADEIRAVIIKVDGDKVTFAEAKRKGEKGPEKTMPVAKDLKVTKGKFNQETKKLE